MNAEQLLKKCFTFNRGDNVWYVKNGYLITYHGEPVEYIDLEANRIVVDSGDGYFVFDPNMVDHFDAYTLTPVIF